MRKLPCLLAVAIGLFALNLTAQISSDQVPQTREVPLKEAVEGQMTQSRWKWGPLRVEPTLRLSNFGYNANVFGTGSDEVSDFSATVGAGVRAIVPLGPNTFIRLDGIPEYTWYKDLADRRRFGWEAGGSYLALFNRLQVEVGGNTRDTVGLVNSEELRPTGQRVDRFFGNLEVEVIRRVSIFVGAERRSTELDPVEEDAELNLNLLDRDEDLQRVGLRYKFRPDVSIYGVYEQTQADFPNDETYSSNDGEAVLLGFSYDRERFYLNIVGGQRTIEYDSPDAAKFDEPTGSGFLAFKPFGRTEIGLSVSRRPVYSTFVNNPFFYESRAGLQLSMPMGDRLVLLGGYEAGENEYQTPVDLLDGSSIVRIDDVDSWRAGLGFQLKGGVVLDVTYNNTSYTSNLDSLSRDVGRVQLSVTTSFFTFTTQ